MCYFHLQCLLIRTVFCYLQVVLKIKVHHTLSITRMALKFSIIHFQPYNATRIAASGIDSRVKQLAKDTKNDSNSKGGFWDEFEVCVYFTLNVYFITCDKQKKFVVQNNLTPLPWAVLLIK